MDESEVRAWPRWLVWLALPVIVPGIAYVVIVLWTMAPWLAVLAVAVVAFLVWRLRVADRRLDQIIAESTARDGDDG